MTVVLTPSVRQGLRNRGFWLITGAVIIVIAVVVLTLRGTAVDSAPFSAGNATPTGSRALAEVLRREGVTVTATQSLAATRAAAVKATDTTVLLSDPDGILTDRQLTALLGIAHAVVVITPTASALRILAPGVHAAGAPAPTTLSAGTGASACPVTAVIRAGTISAGGSTYRALGAAPGTTTCLPSAGGGAATAVYSLVVTSVASTRVTVVGATAALTNEFITDHGNAAFALNLLGADRTLIWYLPSTADLPTAMGAAELTPGWVTPVGALLALTVVVAGFWRGRRFGPLIVESLPVMVRASETMEGRARLYQQSSARLRALDALRVGTLGRLAQILGLASTAPLAEIVLATSAALGVDTGLVRDLLVDAVPGSDRELVSLSDRLLTLETDLARAIRP